MYNSLHLSDTCFLAVLGHPVMGPLQRIGHPGARMTGLMNPYEVLQGYSLGPRGAQPSANMGPLSGGMPTMTM